MMKSRHYLLTSGMALLGAVMLSGTSCPMTVPGSSDPAAFTNADTNRGGKLYDKWWKVISAADPTGNHALYPSVGTQTGTTTWRCKECHGWDYKGKDGAYATGSSHFTGIIGIFGSTKTAQECFDLVKNDSTTTTNGHGFGTAGMADADIWDVVRFVKKGLIDTDEIINSTSKTFAGTSFTGNATTGATLFASGIGTGTACLICHGTDGKTINFGTAAVPEFVGTVAIGNPWEFQHKVRYGQPDPNSLPMPASVETGGTLQDVADVGAHAQTLPQS